MHESCFGQEYQKLLSHRRTIGDVNPEQLRDALFQRRMKPEKYDTYDERVRRYADEILVNMQRRFSYSKESILFALRKHIIDFEEIITERAARAAAQSPPVPTFACCVR